MARLRGLGWWLALAAAIAAAVVWRVGYVRDAVTAEVDTNHAVTTHALLVRVSTWAQTRAAHAETMAALLAEDLATAEPDASGVESRFARAMELLAARETFAGGRVVDRDGAVLAQDGVSAASDAPHDEDAGDRRSVPLEREVAANDAGDAGDAGDADDGRVRIVTVSCGRSFCAEFRAPVLHDGRSVGTVVLVAAVDDSTFRPLNAVRPEIRTARASVLAPLASAGADTVAVVASLGAPDSPEPPPRLARQSLAAAVQEAFSAPPGQVVTGMGAGPGEPTVQYAVGRVPELDWLVMREIEREEVLGTIRRVVLVEETLLVALLVSIIFVVRNRLRAGRARRERELTRLRADFVASTSHELRTPLAQIRMFAELLQRGTLRRPEEAARALRIIEKEASRLTILVDNLLNYSRLRRRAEDAEADTLAPTNVADDVQHVLEAFAPLAAERGVRVVTEVPEGLYARVDSLALRQVLINYLENAVKYGPSGQTVVVGAAADGRVVRLWVDDEGTGVPAGERDQVWEAFQRGAGAEESGQGGSGIGLAVVRELALQYRGGVALEEAPDGGARFVVEFPLAGGPSGGA